MEQQNYFRRRLVNEPKVSPLFQRQGHYLGCHWGVRNDPVYVKIAFFEKFPFQITTPEIEARIRELGEALVEHRTPQQPKGSASIICEDRTFCE